jgi:glycosyltransferase involved in cell wall biosynthesis
VKYMPKHMRPSFSIIITSHKRPILLERALRSLYIQENQDFEVIIAMDVWCSQSLEVVDKSANKIKKLLILPGAKGPSETRNEAKRHAQGHWIIFLDDDDQLLPTYLEDLLAFELDEQRISWTNYLLLKERIEENHFEQISWHEINIQAKNIDELEVSNFIPNSALIYPKNILKQIEFDTQLSSLEDWDFLIQAKRKFQFQAIPIFGPVISMPQNKKTRNSHSQEVNDHFMDIIHIYRKWRSDDENVRLQRMKKINNRHLLISADHF